MLMKKNSNCLGIHKDHLPENKMVILPLQRNLYYRHTVILYVTLLHNDFVNYIFTGR